MTMEKRKPRFGDGGLSDPGGQKSLPAWYQASDADMDLACSVVSGRILDDALHLATARTVAIGLVREMGIALPLLAFRERPRPHPRMQALVLDELERIAQNLESAIGFAGL